jgi:hypothetical protein
MLVHIIACTDSMPGRSAPPRRLLLAVTGLAAGRRTALMPLIAHVLAAALGMASFDLLREIVQLKVV